MKILVMGSGGREHALVWKLKQSPRATRIYCAPGNAGTGAIAENVPVAASDLPGLLKFALAEKIDLTVVGPDDALAAGIVDLFQQNGLRIFGPTRAGARFESSKIFAKEFMQRHGIPTAASGHFSDSAEAHRFCQKMKYPVVIKADGLALGKGVIIAKSAEEAAKTIHRIMDRKQFGDAGRSIVIEEFLQGQECSIHALVDGKNYLLFPGAQDHKQVFDGDKGPNTGGMGTFSPAKILTPVLEQSVRERVMEPFLKGLQAEGIAFSGLLFPGLMLTSDGIKVLEFNSRFGDPETQVLLTRMKSDLVDLIEATIDGTLAGKNIEWDERAAVCVVMASGGYPGDYPKGKPITGLEQFSGSDDVVIFHAGTKLENGRVVTAGGRVLG
ncbi:MAG TPA: phosphoribosylamine--glycine ligase, partial [Chthoniobacteraceae bacterium]|nr:phosphoribosylamine--glycine ligase [Chthoniobacteraceae bacterium]